MLKQVKKVKDWFNQHVDEPKIMYETKRVFPNRNRIGKGVFIIGVLFVVLWFVITIVAPEEAIPEIQEIHYTLEPYRTISTYCMLVGIAGVFAGLMSWFFSWEYLRKKEEKKGSD